MLVIAYGILVLIGVGVYVLAFCFYELNKIHRQMAVANELAAEANKINMDQYNNAVQR